MPETAHPRLLPTLPGDAYTDPAVFAREQAAIFARHWILVGRADEIMPVEHRLMAFHDEVREALAAADGEAA